MLRVTLLYIHLLKENYLLPILYGLISSASWGAADFLGGLASKCTSPIRVLFLAEIAGFIPTMLLALIIREPIPQARDLLLGAISSIIGLSGLVFLYRALAEGQMTIAAPLSALFSAIIPVILGDYDPLESYTPGGKKDKIRWVAEFVRSVNPQTTWDLGANRGDFSLLASQSGTYTIAIDADPLAIERLYQACKESGNTNLIPLVVDLTNPTPAIGWQGNERMSLFERGPADLALSLALIHHLAIGNNVPFPLLAEFFSKTCKWLVIEFIPKSDPQVQRMLSSREDIFNDYHQNQFEEAFQVYFDMVRIEKIKESERSLYLRKAKSNSKIDA